MPTVISNTRIADPYGIGYAFGKTLGNNGDGDIITGGVGLRTSIPLLIFVIY